MRENLANKKCLVSFRFALILTSLFASCASSQDRRDLSSLENANEVETERHSFKFTDQKIQFPPYFIDKDYVMNVEVFESSLDPNNDDEVAPDGLQIALKRGTPFRVTEEAVDPQGNSHIRLEIGGDIMGSNLIVWVEKSEFAKLFSADDNLVRKHLDSSQVVSSINEVLNFDPFRMAGVEFVPPIKARLSSKPGMRKHPILKKRKFHAGWDYAAPKGTPVKAAAKGTVSFAGKAGAYGNLIKITHGEGYETRYAHLSKILVRKGQTVAAGDHIGNVGSTGRSTGPHLHFEKRLNDKPLTK